MKISTVLIAWMLLVAMHWSCELSIAQEVAPLQLRAAMQSEREKIISGEFSAMLYSRTVSSTGVLLEQRKGQWTVRFDYAMGWSLFDRLDSPGEGFGTFRTFYYVDNSSCFTFKQVKDTDVFGVLYKKNESKSPDDSLFKTFNVRGLGFFNSGNIITNSNKGDRMIFEHLHIRKHSAEIKTIFESKDIRKLWFTHSYGNVNVQVSLWVDQERDFVPIRATVESGGKLVEESATEWERLNGVMVPSRLTGISRISFIPEGKAEIESNLDTKTEEFELKISWKSLNEDVGNIDQLDYRSFDFPKGTRVFSNGKLEYVYGVALPVRKPSAPPKSIPLVSVMLLVSVFLVLSVIFSILWRKWKNHA